jgi:hypothetical protein
MWQFPQKLHRDARPAVSNSEYVRACCGKWPMLYRIAPAMTHFYFPDEKRQHVSSNAHKPLFEARLLNRGKITIALRASRFATGFTIISMQF